MSKLPLKQSDARPISIKTPPNRGFVYGAYLGRRSANKVASAIGCWTLRASDGLLCSKGRVAESGLRHSTRNRAWGNPPWVRIPPLPPFPLVRESRRQKNVTILSLPCPSRVLHLVCPHGQPRYYLLLTAVHTLLAPLFTSIRIL